jgi:hypothetical protein
VDLDPLDAHGKGLVSKRHCGRASDAPSKAIDMDPVPDLDRARSEPAVQTTTPDQSLGARRVVPLHDGKVEIGSVGKVALGIGQERIDGGVGGRLLRPWHPRGQVDQAGVDRGHQ